MAKNYYLILGVSRDASQEQIKGAYRQLAKVLHPDHGGESGPFLDVQRAYAVLGDAAARREYDQQLGQAKVWPVGPGPGAGVGPEPLIPAERRRRVQRPWQGPAPEPLVPEDEERPADLGQIALARSFRTYSPSFDEIFDWLWSNFESLTPPKSASIRNLEATVTVTPEQARRGGHARVLVPARGFCPTCQGRGGVGIYECWRCSGEGAISGELPVSISFPAGMTGSHMVQVPLDRFGIRNLYLTVRFRVSERAD